MMNSDITTKSAYKLLQQLESDPQLQSVEDTSILKDEQYPVSFEASIINLKDNIPLTSAVMILRWNEATDSSNLTKDQLQRMKTQRQKTIRNLGLNPTVDNPWDKIKFNFWKDRVTNICLGAAQAAFQTHDDASTLKFLFTASDKSNTVVQRADQRNVQGMLLFHPILLKSPWEVSSSIDADIDSLIQEKNPLVHARANSMGPWLMYEMQLQQNARQQILSMESSLKLLLARIQKFTSHTFHVFLRDLIPGAKLGRSLLFTRVVEHRNQYLARNRTGGPSKEYSALDTLSFIEANYVQDNDNSVHIAWTAILLHTREVLLPLYQWQTSFDPLTRKYEQAKGKTLSKSEFRKLKCLIAKQITDEEKVILAGIDPSFTIENVDKGDYVLRNFQEKLAANAGRFQSKKYSPDTRILTYLRIRAKEFNVPLPPFMKKRPVDKGKGSVNPKRSRLSAPLSRNPSRFQNRPQTNMDSFLAQTPKGKGPGKGKGKATTKGARSGVPSSITESSSSTPTSAGPQNNSPASFKGKGKQKGKPFKGKSFRPPHGGATTQLICNFCHLHGHTERNCRKKNALHHSTSYQQARSQFNNRQQLVMDQLENSLFAPNVCSWCLQANCTTTTCHPPEDPEFYTEMTHLFQSTLLPYVQNAKLGLAVDNAAPLMPQHLAFEGADWGQSDTQVHAFDMDENEDFDPTTESTWDELLEYHSGDLQYDHYVAPNQSIEDQFDYDQNQSENADGYYEENSLHQDTLIYENHDVNDVTANEEPFEEEIQ